MKICGLNKTTLLDYPGRVASTIFLGGCNFRCPFCHNSSLVLHPELEPSISQEEILAFLKKRKGILEGVCITGGEPTLDRELPEFLKKIRELGYPIKLDTNGSRPDILKKLTEEHLVDKIAMDIKASPENYHRLTGIAAPDLDAIRESAAFLLHAAVFFAFGALGGPWQNVPIQATAVAYPRISAGDARHASDASADLLLVWPEAGEIRIFAYGNSYCGLCAQLCGVFC